jgi:general stress protein 26
MTADSPRLDKKLDDLYDLIDGIEVAMLTTRRRDGRLVSRAMQTQRRTAGTDLWFVTSIESAKFEELAFDPQVNVAYFRDRTKEWVSVSGRAILSQDRDLIHGLYKPDWRIWFGDEGGRYDGSADDPRLALVLVEAESVVYFKKDKSAPLVLFELAKAMITRQPAELGADRTLDANELRAAAQRSQAGEGDLRS